MQWLNYHHLLYFWLVIREGGLAPAAAKLRLSPPTVSAQVHALEHAVGEQLLEKRGRKLALTEMGHMVFGYAESIFALGRELQDALQGRPTGRPTRLAVGVNGAVSKLIARRLLSPAQGLGEPVQLLCREDHPERLLASLALHELDAVLTDSPARETTGASVKLFSHLLGECAVSFFASRALAKKLRPRFPRSLEGAPVLLPTETSALRRQLDVWLDAASLRPTLVGEFDDTALLKVFAEDGAGFIAAPSILASDLERQHGLVRVGAAAGLEARFYAITAERRMRHPAVVAMLASASRQLVARGAARRPLPSPDAKPHTKPRASGRGPSATQ